MSKFTATSFPRTKEGRTQYSGSYSPDDLLSVEFPYKEKPNRTGGYGDVFHGRCNGQDVAVKLMRYIDSDLDDAVAQERARRQHEERLWKEVQIMVRLGHDNILQFTGLCLHQDELCIVSPWVKDSMTLLKFLRQKDNANRHGLMCDVAAALAYLHKQLASDGGHLVHGDLHEKNVLIDIVEGRSPRERALLCDFGLSKVVPAGHDASYSFHGGARAGVILAPELQPLDSAVAPGIRNKATDIFAFGALAYTAYKGQPPYKDQNINSLAIAALLGQGNRPERPARRDLTDGMWELISVCWAQHPSSRPTIEGVISRLVRCAPA